jgi:flagellin
MPSINYNVMAEEAASEATAAYNGLNTALNRLSSGLRINSALDDPAGLAVSDLLRADITTARQASKNAGVGISIVQTADGAGGAIRSNLIQMKRLATQAAGGSYSGRQKRIMQQEFGQLSAEITRITETTEFNGNNLFTDGRTIAISLGDGQTIDIDTQAITIESADLITDPVAAQTIVQDAIEQVSDYLGNLGAKANRLAGATAVIDSKAENLLAAESRVSDVDVARQVTSLMSNQIVTRSATSAQAHSNTILKVVQILLG